MDPAAARVVDVPRNERPQRDIGPIRYAWIAFALVAYPALAGAVYSLVTNTVFWTRAEATDGTVIGWDEMETTTRLPADIDPAKANVVSFRTADGEEIVFVTEWGSSMAVYNLGETVTVLYQKDDPQQAKIRGFISLYVGPLLLLFMGGAFWLVSVMAKAVVT